VSGDADAVGTIEGNGGGLARGFVPVSIPDITVTQSVFLTNLLLPELSATVYPFGALSGYAAQNTFLSVSGAALMRPTVGAGPIEGIAATATDLYLGTEATAELEIGIAPFVSINLNGGMFFPYAPALLDDSITYRAVGTVEVRF
jgi:hypothetical protein